MSFRISKQQLETQEAIAREDFRRSLSNNLTEAYPDYSPQQRDHILEECLRFAATADIITEHGLTSLAYVSFAHGSCIANNPLFRTAQKLTVARTGNTEAVACALYEALG